MVYYGLPLAVLVLIGLLLYRFDAAFGAALADLICRSHKWPFRLKLITTIVFAIATFVIGAVNAIEYVENPKASTCFALCVALFLSLLGLLSFRISSRIEQAEDDEREMLQDKLEKEKAASETQADLSERLMRDKEFYGILNDTFLAIVSQKAERFRQKISPMKQSDRIEIAELLQVSNPRMQIKDLVAAVYSLIKLHLQASEIAGSGLRIALYREHGQVLKTFFSWDGYRMDRIRGHQKHKDRFTLNGDTNKSLAVHVAFSGLIHAIPDAAFADMSELEPFHYFDGKQKSTIKSIVGIPLGGQESGGWNRHVICLDSGSVNAFTHEHLEIYTLIRRNLEERLLLELDLLAVQQYHGGNSPSGPLDSHPKFTDDA